MIYSSQAIAELFEEVSDLSKVDGFTYNFCIVTSVGMPTPDEPLFLEDGGAFEDINHN
ncbi:MAG: hypothetical protein ACEPO8_02395 [Rhodothermaceae bacterium]